MNEKITSLINTKSKDIKKLAEDDPKSISNFINTKSKQIKKLAEEYPKSKSLIIDYDDLFKFDLDLAEELLKNPDEIINLFEEALADLTYLKTSILKSDAKFYVRFINLPETNFIPIKHLASEHINKFVNIEGIVNRIGDILPKVSIGKFICNRCGEETWVEQPKAKRTITQPVVCKSCDRRDFRFVPDESKFIDIQRMEVQESLEILKGGEQARRIEIWAEEDMTDRVTAGDKIIVNGTLRLLPQPKQKGGSVYFRFIDANYIDAIEKEFEELDISDEDMQVIEKLSKDPKIYDNLIASIAPSIYGFKEVKEAIVLQLFGARHGKKLPDGTSVRPDIHLLMIGDPGVAKCVCGETKVLASSGSIRKIKDIVEEVLKKDKNKIDDGHYGISNHSILSMNLNGKINETISDIFWKREAPEYMYEIVTETGQNIRVTPTHPLFIPLNGKIISKKAEELNEGEYIATPRKLNIKGKKQKIDIKFNKGKTNANHIKTPEETSPEFSRFIAYILAEGYIRRTKTTCEVNFTNNCDFLIEDFQNCALELFDVTGKITEAHKGKLAKSISLHSIELGRFLKSIDKHLFSGSSKKRIPDIVMQASNEEIIEFIRTYFDCESWVSKKRRTIVVSSASKDLLESMRILLLRLEILSQIHSMQCRASNSPAPKWKEYYRLTITGEDVAKFAEKIGFGILKKKNRLKDIMANELTYNTNLDVVPDTHNIIREIRAGLRMNQCQCGVPRGTYLHFELGDRNPSRKALINVTGAFHKRINEVKGILSNIENEIENENNKNLENIRTSLNISQDELAALAGVSQSLISQYESGVVKKGNYKTIKKIINAMKQVCKDILLVENEISQLNALANSDVFWDKIASIQKVKSKENWVYDLQVEKTHNFIANNIFVHNSRLLQYVDEIAPKSVYVSGKSTSAGGLCISPDSLITTHNGSIEPLKNIIENKLKNNFYNHSGDIQLASNPRDNRKLFTFNDDFKNKQCKIEQFWKIKPPEQMISITTRMGRNIVITPNTKLSTINNGEFIWKNSSTFTTGEYIATARKTQVNTVNNSKKLTIELIKSNPVVYGVKNIVKDMIDKSAAKYKTTRNLAKEMGFSEMSVYYNWINENSRSNIHLNDLKKLARESGTHILNIAPHITELSLSHGKKITIPTFLNKDLLYFAGLVAGDGSIYVHKDKNIVTIRFSNKNKELLHAFKNLSENLFNVNCDIPPGSKKRTHECRFHSKLVFEILEQLGIPRSPKSPKIDLNNILLKLPDELLANYIKGLYDSDGSITKSKSGGNSLELYTTSENLAKKLTLVLLRFGIVAKIRTREPSKNCIINGRLINSKHTVYIIAIRNLNDIKLFDKFIGFNHTEKNEKIKEILKDKNKRDYHTNVDVIPGVGSILKNVRDVYNLKLNRKYENIISERNNPKRDTLAGFIKLVRKQKDNNIMVAIPAGLKNEIYDKLSQKLAKNEIYNKFKITYHQFYDYFMRHNRMTKIPLKLLTEISVFLEDESILEQTTPGKQDINNAKSEVGKLEKLAKSDIFWDEITDIKVINNEYEFVYDFTAENTHSFLANGILVHNTAIAEKDEFAEGAWTLKAGALVIAGGGIACLHPDTNVIINNKILPIGNFFDNSLAYKAQTKSNDNNDNNEIIEINDITASVPAFNVSKSTVKSEKATAIRKKRYIGKMREFTFESGFSLKVTADHLILSGSTLKWIPAGDFAAGDFAVSPLKLPANDNKIYILDIVPGKWKVSLLKSEKQDLKKIILNKYKSLAEFNKKFELSRHILSSDMQFSAEQFRKVLCELDLYDKWREKPLHYARKSKTNFMEIPCLTPELGYLFGFIYGDGHVEINKRRANIHVVQSTKHTEYIQKFKECWKMVFGKEPDMPAESILLGELYNKFVGEKLKNILLLPDEVLKSFIAGAMDADGCISIKNYVKNDKPYKTVHVEFLLSNDTRANLNFILALRRFDCYSKLIDKSHVNVQSIIITGRKDILCLKDSIKKYSIKAQKEIPIRIHNVSSASDKLPSGVVSEISKDISKINKTRLINDGIWSKIYAYKKEKYLPSRDQLAKISNKLSDIIAPELNDKIQLLMCRDFFIDKIKSINEFDFDGFVYDLYVPGRNNFVAEGIFVHNCIDEFDKMERSDQSSMHEAMEQQSYHPDTPLMLADGTENTIGNFVDELMNKFFNEVIGGVNCQILPLEKIKKINIFTTDFKEIYETNINRVSRHTAPENFIKITLQNNRSVVVTPEHPCWVIENGKITTKRADEVMEDDICPVPAEKNGASILDQAKVVDVEKIPNNGVEWVYDVTVEPNQTFISNNMILHNTISVAKAGIVAKFRANTSILAAANPKFSRFDVYKPLGDQFDIPPTLLSRFDLIFAIRDILDIEQDKKIAAHILKMHKGEKELEEIKPKIETELFKKYIAYARIHVRPVLSDDSADKIGEYYTTLRAASAGGRVSATARQLEALVRLSEASAKTRLSEAVTVSDVERAIILTNHVMKEIATDESGAIDIDRIVTSHPKSERDKIYTIENIVKDLCQSREDKLAPMEDILEKAEEVKIDKNTTDKILNELKKHGVVFEPKNDKWKWVG